MQKRQEVLKRLAARSLRKTWSASLRRLYRPVGSRVCVSTKMDCEFEITPHSSKQAHTHGSLQIVDRKLRETRACGANVRIGGRRRGALPTKKNRICRRSIGRASR